MHWVELFLGAMLVNNIVLARFLGVCPFLGVSSRMGTARGMGFAVLFVMTLASAVTWLVFYGILEPLGITYLSTMASILVIASVVQFVEIVMKKFWPALYRSLGIFLPLITTNCAVLGVAVLNVREGFGFVESLVHSLGTAGGFMLALVLFAGSMAGNPALPTPQAADQARAAPKGVFRVTRHPMMWGFALWAASHMVLFWSMRTMITAFAMGFLALVGAHMQDLKKQRLMGDAWLQWESQTSYWPRWGAIFTVGAIPWSVGLILFVFFSWLHLPVGGIAAGIWRWF